MPLPLSLSLCRVLRGDRLGPADLPADGCTGSVARAVSRLLAAVEAAGRGAAGEEERRRRVEAVGASPCTLILPGCVQ